MILLQQYCLHDPDNRSSIVSGVATDGIVSWVRLTVNMLLHLSIRRPLFEPTSD
jgi:hypothetical protein